MRFFTVALSVMVWANSARAAETPVYQPPPNWVRDVAIPAPSAQASGPAEVLLKDLQIQFDEQGRHIYTRNVIRIRTEAGLAEYGNLAFIWNPVLENLIIHRVAIRRGNSVIDLLEGGKSVAILRREENLDQAKLDGALTASIQPAGLRIGDILEISATNTHLDSAFQGKDEVNSGFVMDSLTGRLHIRTNWPSARAFRWRTAPGLPAAKAYSSGNTSGITIEADQVQPLELPTDAPARFLDLGYLEVTEFQDFASISRTLFPLFAAASKLDPDPDLDAAIADIDKNNSTDAARTIAALRLVQEKIRYIYVGIGNGGYVPAGANLTWNRRFGDCKGKSALLIAILAKLGIAAEAALVQTNFGDGLDQRLPLVQAFDHVIVRVELGGHIYWIDPTRFGDRSLQLSPNSDYSWALPLRVAGAALERLPQIGLEAPSLINETFMDARDGITLPIKQDTRTTFRGDSAVALNITYDSLNNAQRDELLRSYWKSIYNWEEIEAVSFNFDPEKRETVIGAMGKVKIKLYAGKNGGKQFSLASGKLGWNGNLERKTGRYQDTPFKVDYPSFVESKQSIMLPYNGFGYSIDSEPIDQKIGPWHLQRTASLSEGIARVSVKVRTLAAELPASQAKSVSTMISAIREKQAIVQIAANLPGTPEEIAALKASILNDEDDLLNRAHKLSQTGDYKGAIADYNTILAKSPNSEWALANRAIVYLNLAEIAKAEEDIAKALAVNANNYVANNAAGNLAYRKRDYQRAIEFYTKSIQAEPNDLFPVYARVKSYARLKNYALAIMDLDKLHNKNPEDPFYLIRLALTLARDGQTERAMSLMDMFVETSKDDPKALEDAIMARALVAIAGKLADRAVADANGLLAKEPQIVPLLIFRCKVFTALDEQLQAGLKDCNEALKLDPEYPDGFVTRGALYLKLNMPKLAQRDFQSALRFAPASILARSGLGIAKMSQGKSEGAGEYRASLIENPDIDTYWEELGVSTISVQPIAQ